MQGCRSVCLWMARPEETEGCWRWRVLSIRSSPQYRLQLLFDADCFVDDVSAIVPRLSGIPLMPEGISKFFGEN